MEESREIISSNIKRTLKKVGVFALSLIISLICPVLTASAAPLWTVTTGAGPHGVVVDGNAGYGNIYVTNTNANTLQKFNNAGALQWTVATGTDSYGVAYFPNSIQSIYVTSYSGAKLQKYSGFGVLQWTQMINTYGVAVDGGANAYVTDGVATVLKYDSTGILQGQAATGSGPRGVAVDSGGNIYVACYTSRLLQKFNSAGVLQGQVSTVNSPENIAVDGSGNIYATAAGQLLKYDSSGTLQWTAATGSESYGLALDGGGNVYVTDPGSNTLKMFNGSGALQWTVATGTNPRGVAIVGGYVYVVNYGANTLQKFAVNTYTITATGGNGGSISPSGAVVVNNGSNQTFTITPNTGYHITDVTVDGVSQGAITSYTFNNVTADHMIAATFAINPQLSSSSDYFYDDLGRLSRVVQGTSGVVYNYDELGNLLSTTSATTSGGAPVLTAINPNVLFVGSKMLVAITGQNLLTTETVTANGGLVSIKGVEATDSRITAEMTALSAGAETIKVTTRSGATATIDVTLSESSTLSFSPSQLALTPGTSGTLTASISPPINIPLTINIYNNAPSTVAAPQTVTIPASGSASFTVNALQLGMATLDAGDPRSIVFVENPFVWDVGETVLGNSANVSVMIDSPPGTSPSTSNPVSVIIDAPAGSSPSTSNPVSVIIDAPPGMSPTVSGGVSVKIQ